jgi:hypothetical protein
MDVANFIELGVLLIAVLTFLIVLRKMNKESARDRESNAIKIQSNYIKIVRMDRDIMAMKKLHDLTASKLEKDFAAGISGLHAENREDHGKLFDKLETVIVELTKTASSFEMYIKNQEAKTP